MPDAETRWLPIWVRDGETLDLGNIKAAKLALDLPFTVIPCVADAQEHRRILCVGSLSPWLGDKFLVAANASQAELMEALTWVLGDGEDWQAITVLDELQAVFGSGVREITPDEIVSEQAMSDYLSGRV